MRAFIFVMEHPFFAVTDAQGRFTIKNLSPPANTCWSLGTSRSVKINKASKLETAN